MAEKMQFPNLKTFAGEHFQRRFQHNGLSCTCTSKDVGTIPKLGAKWAPTHQDEETAMTEWEVEQYAQCVPLAYSTVSEIDCGLKDILVYNAHIAIRRGAMEQPQFANLIRNHAAFSSDISLSKAFSWPPLTWWCENCGQSEEAILKKYCGCERWEDCCMDGCARYTCIGCGKALVYLHLD